MKNLKELLDEEEILQLKTFSNKTAWEIGSLAAGIALERDLPVMINIDRYGQCLFHAALPGTGPDNTLWIEGKKRICYHFQHSSLYMAGYFKHHKKDLKQNNYLDPDKYRLKGGAFPIQIKDTGLVAVLTISGLKDFEDHDFAVEILKGIV